jgi:hypothetical protein
MIKNCFRNGVMAVICLLAKVTDIFKSGDRSDFNNYWPISISTISSQLIESLVFDYIHHYLIENKYLNKNLNYLINNLVFIKDMRPLMPY